MNTSEIKKANNQWLTSDGTLVRKVCGGRCNIFLISKAGAHILVDTGMDFMRRKLIRRLDEMKIENLQYLILTHTHFDHAANASAIKDKFNPKVIVHDSEAAFLLSGDSPLPAGTNTFTRQLIKTFSNPVRKMARYKPCPVDIHVHEEVDLSVCGIDARVIHTPGHSPGSVSILIDNEIALVGDTLIGVLPNKCFPPFADNVEELIKSWRKLIKFKCTLLLPSHGTPRSLVLLKQNLMARRAMAKV
ncbi:MAG TPA: MBL fold metallo-hydrolase [Lentimicrobium sp.]|nr:MBL fold metallo-hydrolase [Lentimicrobium sp.]